MAKLAGRFGSCSPSTPAEEQPRRQDRGGVCGGRGQPALPCQKWLPGPLPLVPRQSLRRPGEQGTGPESQQARKRTMGAPVLLGFSLVTWALLLVLFAACLLYGIWPYNFFKKLGIPGPRPLPFIGTLYAYRKGILDFDQSCYQKYGKIWGIFDGRQPVMAILDPAIIKTILIKEFYTHFTNRRNFGLNGDLDTAITVVEDEQWKRIRTVLSPNFTSGRLKEMLPIINHYGENLVRNIQKKVDDDEVIDMKMILAAYSLDVVASTSFSIDIDSLNHPDNPLVVNIKKILSFGFFSYLMSLVVIFPFLAPLLNKINVTLFPRSPIKFFTKVFQKIKNERKEEDHKQRVDFLQLMMESQVTDKVSDETNSYKALTDKEILSQATVFIFGGYETTGTTLSFLSYCLAVYPDVQEKLYQEISEFLPNQATPTYEATQQMEYLDMVVNETLRLYPPGGRIERVCKKTVEIQGVTIPEGTVAMIPAFVLHRIPEYWSESEEFRPERFNKESRENLDPYIFLPFGLGPRNCIAMRFALLVLKVAVIVLVQKFRFLTCKDTLIPMELDSKGFMKPKKPIMLKLVSRDVVKQEE